MACTGFDGALGVGVADATLTSAASYTAVNGARDLMANISAGKADSSDRTSSFKSYVISDLDCEITATFTYDPNEAIQATIRSACIARTRLVVGVFDNDIGAGAEGLAFDAHVFSNDIAQPLAEGQTYSVSFAPAAQGSEPEWVSLA